MRITYNWLETGYVPESGFHADQIAWAAARWPFGTKTGTSGQTVFLPIPGTTPGNGDWTTIFDVPDAPATPAAPAYPEPPTWTEPPPPPPIEPPAPPPPPPPPPIEPPAPPPPPPPVPVEPPPTPAKNIPAAQPGYVNIVLTYTAADQGYVPDPGYTAAQIAWAANLWPTGTRQGLISTVFNPLAGSTPNPGDWTVFYGVPAEPVSPTAPVPEPEWTEPPPVEEEPLPPTVPAPTPGHLNMTLTYSAADQGYVPDPGHTAAQIAWAAANWPYGTRQGLISIVFNPVPGSTPNPGDWITLYDVPIAPTMPTDPAYPEPEWTEEPPVEEPPVEEPPVEEPPVDEPPPTQPPPPDNEVPDTTLTIDQINALYANHLARIRNGRWEYQWTDGVWRNVPDPLQLATFENWGKVATGTGTPFVYNASGQLTTNPSYSTWQTAAKDPIAAALDKVKKLFAEQSQLLSVAALAAAVFYTTRKKR